MEDFFSHGHVFSIGHDGIGLETTSVADIQVGKMTGIQAVCLDLFGTLIHFGGGGPNPYRYFLEVIPKGVRLPFMTVDRSIEDWAKELNVLDRVPTIQKEVDALLSKLQWYPEVPEFLSRVQDQGWKVSWCSNLAPAYGPACDVLLSSLPVPWVGKHFSYAMGCKKPDPAMYDGVAQTLQLSPAEILFVGDSWKNDVMGPRTHGMSAWQVKRPDGLSLLDCPFP